MAARKQTIRRKPEGTYHHGDLKTALKHAALRLVRDKGPRDFSLNEASRLAGVSVGAPYRHFADKDALLAEIACDGNVLLEKEVREAAAQAMGVRQQMLEAGMAYLRFARIHADYFSVIFQSGLDPAKYPELARTGSAAFGVILALAGQTHREPQGKREFAASAWALVHGLATLSAAGALAAAQMQSGEEHLRPVVKRFLQIP